MGGAINGILITWPPEAFADYPPYYTGWIGFAVAIIIVVVNTRLSRKQSRRCPDRSCLLPCNVIVRAGSAYRPGRLSADCHTQEGL